MKRGLQDGDIVKIAAHAHLKYSDRRAGAVGEIFDVFQSDKSGGIVLEIDFSAQSERGGLELIHESDLELVKASE